jgi:valacyclovir hydrolase
MFGAGGRTSLVRAISTTATPRGCSAGNASGSKAPVNGVQLHYERRGTGPHPLICLPGALGTALSDFKPQLEYFGREGSDYTIIAFDPRGYGLSRPINRFERGSNFFLADAKDAHTLMQYLSFPKYSVMGWSDGGIASLVLASLYPESVRKMVVLGANAFITQEDIDRIEKTRDISKWSERMREHLTKVYGDTLQELWSNWMDSILEFNEKHDGDICIKELSKIKCPTLIVHGAKDPLVPSFHPDFLRDHVTGSRVEVFKEGKHNLHLRYHQEFNKMVDQFLQSSVVSE